MDTRTAEAIAKMSDELMSGKYFARRAEVNRANQFGTTYYKAPLTARDFGSVVQVLGRMASYNDQMAQIANVMLHNLPNRWGTGFEAAARLYEGAAKALGTTFDDVLARSGPEPCRYSDAQHDFPLTARILTAMFLEEMLCPLSRHFGTLPGPGWVLSALWSEKMAGPLPEWLFPNLAAERKRQAESAARSVGTGRFNRAAS